MSMAPSSTGARPPASPSSPSPSLSSHSTTSPLTAPAPAEESRWLRYARTAYLVVFLFISVVVGAMLFMVLVGMIHLPSDDVKDYWVELLSQILTASYTVDALIKQPAALRWLRLSWRTWRESQRLIALERALLPAALQSNVSVPHTMHRGEQVPSGEGDIRALQEQVERSRLRLSDLEEKLQESFPRMTLVLHPRIIPRSSPLASKSLLVSPLAAIDHSSSATAVVVPIKTQRNDPSFSSGSSSASTRAQADIASSLYSPSVVSPLVPPTPVVRSPASPAPRSALVDAGLSNYNSKTSLLFKTIDMTPAKLLAYVAVANAQCLFQYPITTVMWAFPNPHTRPSLIIYACIPFSFMCGLVWGLKLAQLQKRPRPEPSAESTAPPPHSSPSPSSSSPPGLGIKYT
ncbi:hypothetical protein RI367_000869 [Sorochytrium milnesiophthora]